MKGRLYLQIGSGKGSWRGSRLSKDQEKSRGRAPSQLQVQVPETVEHTSGKQEAERSQGVWRGVER